MNSYFSAIWQTGGYQSSKLRMEKTHKAGDSVPDLIKNLVPQQLTFPDFGADCKSWLTCCSADHHKISCDVACSHTGSNL